MYHNSQYIVNNDYDKTSTLIRISPFKMTGGVEVLPSPLGTGWIPSLDWTSRFVRLPRLKDKTGAEGQTCIVNLTWVSMSMRAFCPDFINRSLPRI